MSTVYKYEGDRYSGVELVATALGVRITVTRIDDQDPGYDLESWTTLSLTEFRRLLTDAHALFSRDGKEIP